MISNNKLTLYVLSFLTLLILNQCYFHLSFFLQGLTLPKLDIFHLNEPISYVVISAVNLLCCSWVILKSASKIYRNWAFCLIWASSAFFILFSASLFTPLLLQNS